MDMSFKTYRKLLATIDSELREDNIKSLKFLCEPNLGAKKSSSNFSTGLEIFDALEKNSKLSQDKLFILCELLYAIGRVDLATLIDPDCDNLCGHYRHVDRFRVMLFKLSEELASEDLFRLRYLYQNVPKRMIIADGIDLFLVMLQHKTVSPTNLCHLKQLLEEIDRHDLVDIISKYDEGHQELSSNYNYMEVTPVSESTFASNYDLPEQQIFELNIAGEGETLNHCEAISDTSSASISDNASYEGGKDPFDFSGLWDQHPSIQVQDVKGNDTENIPVSMECAQAVTHLDNAGTAAGSNDALSMNSMVDDESYVPIGFYKMDAVPRGICVVIDNQTFTPDQNDPEAVRNLGNREGSDKDSGALKTSFERLKFKVEVKQNLTDVQIIEFVKSVSAMNHEEFDCFVCCILSHGGENHVFGVNGRKVQLGDITAMFRSQFCPSLARKPKLFFMASCRGKSHQPAVQGPMEPLFEVDKPEVDFDSSEWVPNEADFLYGYSTVINHVSYRSRSQGTFYISELTKSLDRYADREDLQTLLLRVNAAVSERIYSREESTGHVVYKQTPAPQHTLRKHLKFL